MYSVARSRVPGCASFRQVAAAFLSQPGALLRSLLDSLQAGDVVVADRFYCSFMMIALLLSRGVDVCR